MTSVHRSLRSKDQGGLTARHEVVGAPLEVGQQHVCVGQLPAAATGFEGKNERLEFHDDSWPTRPGQRVAIGH